MSLELISFDLCPFVQRSVITLLEKNADFDITYIDLAEPPAWFLNISPFGKVPVLKAENEVIFESAVINEYVDEVTPPSLMPTKPITRAINRAWIEFSSGLLMEQYKMSVAQDQQAFEQAECRLLIDMDKLENQLSGSQFFNGDQISLVDTAYAPLFMRFDILFKFMGAEIYEDKPKIAQWANTLLQRKSVIESVVDDFEDKYLAYMEKNSPFIAQIMSRK